MELPREPHTRGAGAAGRVEGGATRRSHYGLPAWNQPPGLCPSTRASTGNADSATGGVADVELYPSVEI